VSHSQPSLAAPARTSEFAALCVTCHAQVMCDAAQRVAARWTRPVAHAPASACPRYMRRSDAAPCAAPRRTGLRVPELAIPRQRRTGAVRLGSRRAMMTCAGSVAAASRARFGSDAMSVMCRFSMTACAAAATVCFRIVPLRHDATVAFRWRSAVNDLSAQTAGGCARQRTTTPAHGAQ
jgi:hypothetical protein